MMIMVDQGAPKTHTHGTIEVACTLPSTRKGDEARANVKDGERTGDSDDPSQAQKHDNAPDTQQTANDHPIKQTKLGLANILGLEVDATFPKSVMQGDSVRPSGPRRREPRDATSHG